MNFNSVKLFSLLAGLCVAVCGADVKAENLQSNGSRYLSDELSVVDNKLQDKKEGVGAPIRNRPSTQPLTDSSISELSISGPSISDLLMSDGLHSPLSADEPTVIETADALSTNVLSTDALSTDAPSTSFALDGIELPGEEKSFQNETGQAIEFTHTGHDAFLVADLLADGGTPEFGDTLYWSPFRPDSHAPIGVMGDHTHGKGEFMLSYRYMYMDMDGNRSGTESLSEADVLEDFMVTPVQMTMQMHMLGAMYAPTEDLTLMAMLPYVTKEMDHATRNGMRFTTNSEGIGDVSFGGLYTLLDRDRQRVHLNMGMSFPTGSIGERDATPMGPNQVLPYPMQIGSGTFDFQPGVTYLGQAGRWSWGSQAMGKIRVGENSNGYRLGNQFMLTAWGAHSWTDWFSTSLRLGGRTWGNIRGADARLNPNVIPTADPDLRAGTQLDVGLGLNFYVPESSLQGTRLAVEFNLPVYRALSGPQLETDFSATAGLQTSF